MYTYIYIYTNRDNIGSTYSRKHNICIYIPFPSHAMVVRAGLQAVPFSGNVCDGLGASGQLQATHLAFRRGEPDGAFMDDLHINLQKMDDQNH